MKTNLFNCLYFLADIRLIFDIVKYSKGKVNLNPKAAGIVVLFSGNVVIETQIYRASFGRPPTGNQHVPNIALRRYLHTHCGECNINNGIAN